MSLVRVRFDGQEFNASPEMAESQGWEALDEPTHFDDGTARPHTRANGRPVKPKTSVASAAAKKAGQPTAAANPPSSKE